MTLSNPLRIPTIAQSASLAVVETRGLLWPRLLHVVSDIPVLTFTAMFTIGL